MNERCPVCKENVIIKVSGYMNDEKGDLFDLDSIEPLYQVSYPGSKEYVTPRCSICYLKMLEKRKLKNEKMA